MSLLEHDDDTSLFQWVSTIADIETEKQCKDAQKEDKCIVLAKAKQHGKEAYTAVKAQLTQKRAAAAEAKKVERLRITVEQKAEKARLAAESKAR